MAKTRRALAVSAIVAVALLAATAAQDQLPQPTFRTEANYVRVDVYPTRDGSAVPDLTAADFEVFEDKVPQKIEQFQRVVIRAAGSGDGRREPNTVAESREAVKDPRARLFVLFLDPKHVDQTASRTISRPLVAALNRLLGPDDYLGVMVPGLSPQDITFARKTVAIENVLTRDWWGERDSIITNDPIEEQYRFCYHGSDAAIAEEMILRRREKQTLDAFEDLAVFLRDVREERKAVITITDGWLLYEPDRSLARPLDGFGPPIPGVDVDPRNGKLTTRATTNTTTNIRAACEADRYTLSELNDQERIRTIVDEANRANVSFYPVDPRGLVVFDDPTGAGLGAANPTLTPSQDNARLFTRNTSLRMLADATDGLAIVGSNDTEKGFTRITDDMSSYYLLGYYSTGKLDGRFHSVSVRVKRAGVSVRARRGYQALREGDPARSVALAAPVPVSGEATTAGAASSAVGRIVNSVRDLPLRVHVAAGWRPGADGRPVAAFWTVSEVVDRIPGADLEAVLTTTAGEISGSARGRIAPGTTSALVSVVPGPGVQAGDYVVRVRCQSPAGTETMSMPVTLAPPSQSSGAVFIRRGPLTGNREVPTADLRFRRSERLRVEVPSAADVAGARLLDRTGKPLAIPVAATTRTDADGTRWATAELVLAPLAPGDYVMEVAVADTRTMAAFRIVQ